MKDGWRRLVVSVIFVVGSATAIEAQSCTANLTANTCTDVDRSVSVTVGTVVRLSQSTTSTILSSPSIAEYDQGYRDNTGPVLTIQANQGWSIGVRGSTSTWFSSITEPTISPRSDKPIGDLLWSVAPGGPFTPMTTTTSTIATGSATASTPTTLYLRTLWDWVLDSPGDYSVTIVITVTAT